MLSGFEGFMDDDFTALSAPWNCLSASLTMETEGY